MAVATGLNITGSQLFSPFRALGYVSNGVPLALQALGSEHFVATVVGRSFHLYNVSITLILLIVNVFQYLLFAINSQCICHLLLIIVNVLLFAIHLWVTFIFMLPQITSNQCYELVGFYVNSPGNLTINVQSNAPIN